LVFKQIEGGFEFSIKVKPNSRKTELILELDGTIVMHVAASPTGGRANKEIIKWIAKKCKIPSSRVRLIGGYHSRSKMIAVLGVQLDDLKRDLTSQSKS